MAKSEPVDLMAALMESIKRARALREQSIEEKDDGTSQQDAVLEEDHYQQQ